MTESRPTVLYGDLLACDAFDEMERVKKINIPSLLICGSSDRMTPLKHSEYLRDQIEGAHLHIVEEAGHMVIVEQPEQVANLLSAFIDKIPY